MNPISRECRYCGQSDTLPKHEHITGPLMVSIYAHKDCCARNGCELCGPDMAALSEKD